MNIKNIETFSIQYTYLGFGSIYLHILDKPDSSVVKIFNAGTVGFIPGLGRFPGEKNGNPLQYHCLGNPTDRGVWQVTVHRVARDIT